MRVIEEEVGAEVMLLTARVEEVEGVRLVVSVLIIGSLLEACPPLALGKI